MALRALGSLTPDEAVALHAAAVVGAAALALELERLGFSNETDSLADAWGMRTVIVRAAARKIERGGNLERRAESARAELQRRRQERGQSAPD